MASNRPIPVKAKGHRLPTNRSCPGSCGHCDAIGVVAFSLPADPAELIDAQIQQAVTDDPATVVVHLLAAQGLA